MKLSIIIPIYNVEKYLDNCLSSVVYPQLDDYEIILVNDGSTDSSAEIITDYKHRFPDLITVVNKENGGLGSARNAGLKVATGDFVVFLDSDDYLSSNAVPEILKECQQDDFDICFFDQAFYNEDGREVMRYKGAEKDGIFSFDAFPQILFSTPNAGNKIFRRSLFTDSGIEFPPRQWFEDVNSVYKLYLYANTMKYVPYAWNCHLQRTGSITHSKNTSRNLEMIDACEDLLSFYKSMGKYCEELEYCIFYNELLTSVDRVNLIDKKSETQNTLIDWFLDNFPDYNKNKYIKSVPSKYKILIKLIFDRKFNLLNAILKINSLRHS